MHAEPIRRQAGLALALAAIAGFVDAVGFIVLHGLFTAHMSGNAAQVGVRLGHGDPTAAVPLIVAIALFVIGCALGEGVGELAEGRPRLSRGAALLAIQALLVAAFMIYGNAEVGAGKAADHRFASFYVLAALAIIAMGLQASALREVGGQAIRTTYISGVLTNLGQELARLGPWPRASSRRAERWKAGLLGGIAALYLAGATAGSVLHSGIGLWAMSAPLAALLVATALELTPPAAGPTTP